MVFIGLRFIQSHVCCEKVKNPLEKHRLRSAQNKTKQELSSLGVLKGSERRPRRGWGRSSPWSAEDVDEGEEEVEDVEVQGHGGPDVLIVWVALDKVVGVEHNVTAEHDCCQEPVDHCADPAKGEENLQTQQERVVQ